MILSKAIVNNDSIWCGLKGNEYTLKAKMISIGNSNKWSGDTQYLIWKIFSGSDDNIELRN